jgi:tRNA-Thr(GGU) m(6)t(6)A37 methyltransferase TsaA
MQFSFDAIGVVHSCYKDKFAIPRQAGLVTASTATIELIPPFNQYEATRGLEDFSHIWLTFVFHRHVGQGWNAVVKPPRLDGKQRFGVFATRASFRPNPIGMSIVKLNFIEQQDDRVLIHVNGADLLDQTPVLDIKPYVPYSDMITDAKGGFTDSVKEELFQVIFSDDAVRDCEAAKSIHPEIEEFIRQLLSLDHRAYFYKKIKKIYSTRIYDFDLKWSIDEKQVQVISLKPV